MSLGPRPRRRMLKDGPRYTNPMFREPKHKELADIINMTSVPMVEKATKRLLTLFHNTKDRSYRRAIKSATVLAANRARLLAKRVYNPYRSKELQEISKLYEKTYKKMIL